MLLKKWNFLLQKLNYFFETNYNEKWFLPFFRISISSIAIIDLLSMYADIPRFFSQSRTIVAQELLYFPSEYFSFLNSFYTYLYVNHFETYFYNYAVVVYLAALVLLLIGLFSRFFAILSLILQLLIFKSFPECNYGYDNFITMSLFYCVLFPVGKYSSVSNKLFKQKEKNIIFNYQRFIQIHLCIVYFSSGLAKCLDPNWWNGNSIWRAVASISNSYYGLPDILMAITGIGVILLEILYTPLIYYTKTRRIIIILCIVMHFSIAAMLDLYAFAAIMAAWNISAFSNFALSAKKNE